MEQAVIFMCILIHLQTVLYFWHDFYNIILKIKYKLYIYI
jgi:hypothetical protein